MRVIEVFADVICPFTYVGLRQLVAERAARGPVDVSLHIRAWPLELVNGKALDAANVAEEVEALQVEVAPDL
ncbi:MAG: DsbA family oxidoreductase, partial [Acidimicrobiales bacterium]